MLMGGFTTWLGVLPLSLSSTKVFNTIVSDRCNFAALVGAKHQPVFHPSWLLLESHVRAQFISFMAMISWGLLTSLVLMPVLLSMFGPLVCTIGPRETPSKLLAARKQEKLTKIFSPPPLLRQDNEPQLVDNENDDSSLESESDDIKPSHTK